MADAGQPPVADTALGDETLERGHDGFRDGRGGRHALVALASKRDRVVQEHDVNVVELHAFEAAGQARGEEVVDLVGGSVSYAALGGDAHVGRQLAVERGADDGLSLAVAVGGREVEQVNAGVDGLAHGGDALLTGGRSPYLGDAAAAESEGACHAKLTEWSLPHGSFSSVYGAGQDTPMVGVQQATSADCGEDSAAPARSSRSPDSAEHARLTGLTN